ncbi:VOC family protein [Pseudohoeflea coraliihabitans]|uniref:VOC family protein n=1 Tax=Pseudohoeflea coraliihabitans TaxID=2860393 RepID=A0ABS6WME8_9HYPH|nr:VOC family protein [Pseudohoeflea sp. DP4N28-3]MBW3097123.1 VOC family protein [Pseudohoeflea sp. DP4N28-3]
MAVRRIVRNVQVADPAVAQAFYGDVLGMEPAMDMGWIVTFFSPAAACEGPSPVQISFATQGGSGTGVPDLSIEVDDFDAVLARVMERGYEVTYGPVDEPWGVRRFFVRDPAGQIVNILTHT